MLKLVAEQNFRFTFKFWDWNATRQDGGTNGYFKYKTIDANIEQSRQSVFLMVECGRCSKSSLCKNISLGEQQHPAKALARTRISTKRS